MRESITKVRCCVNTRTYPDGVVDNVACEDGKRRVRNEALDGSVHALLQADGRVAVVVPVGTGRIVVIAGAVGGGVVSGTGVSNGHQQPEQKGEQRGPESELTGSRWAWCSWRPPRRRKRGRRGCPSSGPRRWILAARRGPGDGGGRGREGDLVGVHSRVRAETEEGDAEQLRGRRADPHLTQGIGNDGTLEGDDALAHVVILGLGRGEPPRSRPPAGETALTPDSLQISVTTSTNSELPRSATPLSSRRTAYKTEGGHQTSDIRHPIRRGGSAQDQREGGRIASYLTRRAGSSRLDVGPDGVPYAAGVEVPGDGGVLSQLDPFLNSSGTVHMGSGRLDQSEAQGQRHESPSAHCGSGGRGKAGQATRSLCRDAGGEVPRCQTGGESPFRHSTAHAASSLGGEREVAAIYTPDGGSDRGGRKEARGDERSDAGLGPARHGGRSVGRSGQLGIRG